MVTKPTAPGDRAPACSPPLDALSAQAHRISGDVYPPDEAGLPQSHLDRYHAHYPLGTEDDLHFRTTRAIVVAARRWRKLANERVRKVGQTMARWETLFLVANSAEELTQSDLARLISIEGPTLVRMLDLLAQEGLIERKQSETDRRVTTNRITPEGSDTIREIMQVTNELRRQVLEDIPREEIEAALKVLAKVILKINELR